MAQTSNIALARDREDRFEWLLDSTKEYTVKRMCEIQRTGESDTSDRALKTRWSKVIPKKVCFFIWRTRLNRIPCRVNLDARGIDVDSVLCPWCEIDRPRPRDLPGS